MISYYISHWTLYIINTQIYINIYILTEINKTWGNIQNGIYKHEKSITWGIYHFCW